MRTQGNPEVGSYVNLSGTSAVGPAGTAAAPVRSTLLGFYVNSTSSGVIHLRDGGATGTAGVIDLGGDITPAIGFHHYPASITQGLHMTLVSGSINVTFYLSVGGGMAEVGMPVNRTTTGVVGLASTPSALLGFYVNSTTGGTVVFKDGGASGTTVSGTITPAAGAYHRFPCSFPNGCHVTIANTLDVTFFVQQGNG